MELPCMDFPSFLEAVEVADLFQPFPMASPLEPLEVEEDIPSSVAFQSVTYAVAIPSPEEEVLIIPDAYPFVEELVA